MTNPHEKLAMEFFSPPGPSAREWRWKHPSETTWCPWSDGAQHYPTWDYNKEYEIRLKPQTITLPERTIPKPVWEPRDGLMYWVVDLSEPDWTRQVQYRHGAVADITRRRGIY